MAVDLMKKRHIFFSYSTLDPLNIFTSSSSSSSLSLKARLLSGLALALLASFLLFSLLSSFNTPAATPSSVFSWFFPISADLSLANATDHANLSAPSPAPAAADLLPADDSASAQTNNSAGGLLVDDRNSSSRSFSGNGSDFGSAHLRNFTAEPGGPSSSPEPILESTNAVVGQVVESANSTAEPGGATTSPGPILESTNAAVGQVVESANSTAEPGGATTSPEPNLDPAHGAVEQVVKSAEQLRNGSQDLAGKPKEERSIASSKTSAVTSSTIESNGQSGSSSDSGKETTGEVSAAGKCDIFDGRWVRDEKGPLYPGGSCPYIDVDFDCHKNGRPDEDFLRWRWQPNHCAIPRLNATDFLARLKGRRLLFVGDSLNRNMWESLVCILRHSVKNKDRVYEASGRHNYKTRGYYSFRFKDYNCSVDYVRSTFLVRELFVKNANGTDDERLRLDLLDATTSAYRGADVIVFNTGHWWTHEKTSRGIDYYQEGDHVYPLLKVLEAFRRALTTWAKWVDKNIDSSKTQVVFRGYSLTHFSGGQWNSGGHCHKETEPIFNEKFLTHHPSKMRAFEQIMRDMKTPVIYLNVSRLTDYRKDGHPSIYRKKYNSVEEQIAAEQSQDCSHWCLPGVPDTWNELLYASLLMNGKGSWKQ